MSIFRTVAAHIRPGHITAALVTCFSASSLATVGYMLLAPPPAPPSAPLHAAAAVHITTPAQPSLLANQAVAAAFTVSWQAQANQAHTAAVTAAQLAAAKQAAAVQAAASTPPASPPAPPAPPSGGTILSAAQIGALWLSAGGSAAAENVAVCIAEHESGGNTRAVSPTNDWGIWQIHGAGSVAFDPMWNAQTAVRMSGNGTNWSAWTTAGACGV